MRKNLTRTIRKTKINNKHMLLVSNVVHRFKAQFVLNFVFICVTCTNQKINKNNPNYEKLTKNNKYQCTNDESDECDWVEHWYSNRQTKDILLNQKLTNVYGYRSKWKYWKNGLFDLWYENPENWYVNIVGREKTNKKKRLQTMY